MKELILILLDDDRLRKKLSKNAIKHTKQYRDDIVTKNICRSYKKLLNNG